MITKLHGFLLLEACIGIIMLGVLSVFLSSWHTQLLQVENEITQRIKAILLAQSLIERCIAYGRFPMVKKNDGFTVSFESILDHTVPGFHHITVHVSRNSKNHKKVYSLKTGLLLPLTHQNGKA